MSRYRAQACVNQHLIYRSIKKYGWEAHHLEILHDGEMTQDEINRLEIDAIAEAKKTGLSLNISPGGFAGPCYRGKDNPSSKPVLRFDLKGNLLDEWANCREAGEKFSGVLDASSIKTSLLQGRHYAYGYLWVMKADYEKGVRPWHDRVGKRKLKAVVQLTLAGEYVATYPCVPVAAKTITGNPDAIYRCLRGPSHSSGGFLWCYKDDYEAGKRPVRSSFNPKTIKTCRRVEQLDMRNNVVAQYHSISEAARKTGVKMRTIHRRCAYDVLKPWDGKRFRYCEPETEARPLAG